MFCTIVFQSLERQASSRERRMVEVKKTIQWQKFPDGFPNLFIDDVKNMAGKDGRYFQVCKLV